jgi:hypothetical protein
MFGFIDDVKHQIALYVASATFTDALTAIDVEKNDGVVTPAPAQIEECEIETPSTYPCAMVIGVDTEFDQESNPTLQDSRHRVDVYWLAVGDDERTVTKYVERLVRATRGLWGGTFAGAINAAPVQVLREDYSDLARSPDNSFLKGGRVILLVPTLVQ